MEVVCLGCGDRFVRDARHKNQCYCSRKQCQRKRKALWQKQKMINDPDYRLNQKQSRARWAKEHPGYWRRYREKHPEKAERNRLLQKMRNRNRTHRETLLIAKMDASKSCTIAPFGQFYLVPTIAKMDALKVNLHFISRGYP
ncbi:MAG TPA: hypothetical protein ENN05_08105 [Deltaproteobacteria bacterium]|nr:hypothetical protein [Deltaproteobacteria bacterium]